MDTIKKKQQRITTLEAVLKDISQSGSSKFNTSILSTIQARTITYDENFILNNGSIQAQSNENN